jgi:TB2/DP1, HVA22 family
MQARMTDSGSPTGKYRNVEGRPKKLLRLQPSLSSPFPIRRIILGVFNLLDGIADSILSWVPLYFSAKVVFLIWLQLPQFRGAEFLYNTFLRPLFIKHSQAIEARFMAVKDVSANIAKAAGIDLSAIGNNSGASAAVGGGAAGNDAELAPSQVFGASSNGANGLNKRRE